MEQTRITIGSISRQILENYTKKDYKDGAQFWDLRDDVEWQHNLVIEAYKDRMLCPEAYNTVFKILIEIFVAENEDEAEDFLDEIEPYEDINDLTSWLHSSTQNIEYLTTALHENGVSDGVKILAKAHKLFLKDIGTNLIRAISEFLAKDAYFENSVY
jgi:hypothetical protein